MKQVIISTSAGTTITFPHETLPVIEPSGVREKYISEITRGERTLYRGQHAPVKLEQIVGILYDEVEGYREAREFCFKRREGYEIPKLRHDIVTKLASLNPELFEEEEQQRLEYFLFKKEGSDFSKRTISNMVNYLSGLLDACSIKYTQAAYRGWIKGGIIHPENLDNAELIAGILGSESMLRRAQSISHIPKADNLYFKLVNAHRITAAILSAPKGRGTGQEGKEHSKERVFTDLPEWYLPVVDRLRPMIREEVTEAIIYRIELVEPKEEKKDEVRTGLQKGIIVFGDDEEKRRTTYERLAMREPEKRSTSLMRSLRKSFEIYGGILERYVRRYLALVEGMDGIKVTPLENTASHSNEQPLYLPSPDELRFLSPLYDYDFKNLGEVYSRWSELFEKCAENSDFRRTLIREMNRNLPKIVPNYPLLYNFYKSSILFQSLYSENEFLRAISVSARGTDKFSLETIATMSLAERKRIVSSIKRMNETVAQYMRIFTSEIAEEVQDLISIDGTIPREITLFQAIPAISRQLRLKGTEKAERAMLYNVLRVYRIEPEAFMEMQDDVEKKAALIFREEMDSYKTELANRRKPIFVFDADSAKKIISRL